MGKAFQQYGFIPADPWRNYGATWLTNFFVHSGWLHLIFNMYYLVTFGDDAEEFLGRKKLLLLLLVSTWGGCLLALLLKSNSFLPHGGAGGGVSGLLAFYAARFPHHRIYVFAFFRFFRIPSWMWLGAFLVFSLFGTFKEIFGVSPVSHLAHIGGAAAGFFMAMGSRLMKPSPK